jgi:hypothetical protein
LWRRRWLLVLLLGCNDPGLTKGDFEAPDHEIGRYHDAVVKSGVFHVSAYDDSTGDLAYARITDLTRPIGWQYVDGLDPTVPPDRPGGYRHGVSDNGPDVGMYSSIALTKAGAPRIAYYDATNGALKLALGPHPWTTLTVDAGDGTSQVGLYTAITLDDKDQPTIAYMATNLTAGGAFSSEVRVATALTASPGAKDWKITTVAKSAIRCAGLCATGQACLMDAMVNGMPNGDPVHSTCTPVDTSCKSMCATGEACIKGACTKTVVALKGDLPEGIGLFMQARRSATGSLTLVYYDRVEGDLYMATQAAGLFTPVRLDGGSDTADVGQFASAQLDASGTLHVAYVDAIADQLKYVAVTNGMAGMPELVDDGLRNDGPHSVGAGAFLFLDGSSPRVVYQDQVLSDLLQAKRDNGWSHSALESGAVGYGWWPHVLSDGGKRYLTEFVYDRAAGQPVGNFAITPLP